MRILSVRTEYTVDTKVPVYVGGFQSKTLHPLVQYNLELGRISYCIVVSPAERNRQCNLCGPHSPHHLGAYHIHM